MGSPYTCQCAACNLRRLEARQALDDFAEWIDEHASELEEAIDREMDVLSGDAEDRDA